MDAPARIQAPRAPTPEPAAANAARARRLREVAQEFESLLVGALLRSMRATVPESGLLENGQAAQTYRQLYDDELARAATRGGTGLGIADLIVRRYGEAGGDASAPAALPDDAGAADWWPLAPGRPVSGPRRAPATPIATLTDGSAVPDAAPASPPATAPVERFGPPVPPSLRAAPVAPTAAPVVAPPPASARGLAAYRLQAEAGARLSRLAELRRAAEREGGAVADSLRRFEPAIAAAAEETGVDPALLLSVIVHESGGDPRARSPKGALGLMQLMPATAREVGVRQPLDPHQNVRGGARYLAALQERFGTSLDLVLAGYNAGPGAVARAGDRVPPYRETIGYVRKVGDLYQRLQPVAGTDLASGTPRPADRDERGGPAR